MCVPGFLPGRKGGRASRKPCAADEFLARKSVVRETRTKGRSLVFTFDRRGRGDSGDTAPSTVPARDAEGAKRPQPKNLYDSGMVRTRFAYS